MKRALALLVSVLVVIAALVAGAVWRELDRFRHTPYGGPEEKVVVVPPGASARSVVRILAQSGVLSRERVAWLYARYIRRDGRSFRAGEYSFAGPLLPDDVLEKVLLGGVKLYHITVAEGLRADEVAEVVARTGLLRAEDFLAVARDPSVATSLSLPYPGLEGFLFPDTYTVARGITAHGLAELMVSRFKEEYARADAQRKPEVKLSMGQVATLASIVEKETGQEGERPRIACVFYNRLRLGMRLQTDPTVMYATMLRTGHWSKNISKADLLAPHPYNTYTTGGLPPGPIANAGGAALRAVLAPEECSDLYFVSRNDGSHQFCPDLRCHNEAVRTWQVEFLRHPVR
ncbi:MAG TPA: endolytic transglycosylase MltG [Anaeromyxobacter sp.]|nr:endolytic transglycosylase MltG [Anaeromyxobacter sp.]